MTGVIMLFFVALVVNSRKCHAQDNDDAWMLLQGFGGGYLAYTTDNNKDYQCFTLNRLAIYSTNKGAVYAASFEEGDNPTRINTTQVANVCKSSHSIELTFEEDGIVQLPSYVQPIIHLAASNVGESTHLYKMRAAQPFPKPSLERSQKSEVVSPISCAKSLLLWLRQI